MSDTIMLRSSYIHSQYAVSNIPTSPISGNLSIMILAGVSFVIVIIYSLDIYISMGSPMFLPWSGDMQVNYKAIISPGHKFVLRFIMTLLQ